MDYIRNLAYKRMDELAERGIFAEGFDEKSYEDLKNAEKSVRPDMLFVEHYIYLFHILQ